MTEDQIDILRKAAEALRESCMNQYERFTEHSCTDRRNWTREQECRYGSEYDYELSLKLDKMAGDENE